MPTKLRGAVAEFSSPTSIFAANTFKTDSLIKYISKDVL
jgi:hypothetical protein